MEISKVIRAPGGGPTGLAWDGEAVWNADFREGRLYRLAPSTGEVTESVLCPGVPSGLAWDGQHLWQVVLDEGWVRAFNPASHDFDRTIVVEEAGRLAGATWDGHALWVVSQERGRLLALDPASETVTRTVEVPVAAGGLAYRDGMLWVAAPERMRFNARSHDFEWESGERGFRLIRLEASSGRETKRYPLDFLPLGLAWVGDELWLSNAGRGELYVGRV